MRERGRVDHLDGATGEPLHRYTTVHEPSGVLPIACKTRRASQCPPCAEDYRTDTYQVIRAGLSGGKGIPGSVAQRPCVFTTLTAHSFGPVHLHREKDGQLLRCHPRRRGELCPHGVRLSCPDRHPRDDPLLGEPLCPDCYDYTGAVLFNAYAPELWRRFTIALRRTLARQAGRTNMLAAWARLLPGLAVQGRCGMTRLLLTVPEAAEALAISRSKLYELFAAGLVRSVRIDGSRRVPFEELETYMARLLDQEEAADAKASWRRDQTGRFMVLRDPRPRPCRRGEQAQVGRRLRHRGSRQGRTRRSPHPCPARRIRQPVNLDSCGLPGRMGRDARRNRETQDARRIPPRHLSLHRARIGRMRLQALRPAVISKLYRDMAEHGGHDGRPQPVGTGNRNVALQPH